MRVCFISGEYPPIVGGIGDYTQRLARALVALGHQVAVVTSVAAAEDAEEGAMAQEAENLWVLPLLPDWGLRRLPAIRRTVDDLRPDIVHLQYQTGAFGMSPAVNLLPAWLRRHPFVTTFHDLRVPYLFPKAGRLRAFLNRVLIRRSDAIVATNEADRRALARLGAGLKPAVWLIPIGSNIAPPEAIPADAIAAWRERVGVGADGALLCHFGFLAEGKGIDVLFAALKRLRDDGTDVKLLMIGGRSGDIDVTGGAFERAALARLGGLGVADAVVWTDYLPEAEVSAALRAADVGVLPFDDGASLRHGTLMAALAHGLPTVTTRLNDGEDAIEPGGAPVLVAGDNCLLTPPRDVAALAEAVRTLLESPALRARLSEGARRLAAEFTWERIAERHVALYETLLGGRR